jgi:hypothetical protein
MSKALQTTISKEEQKEKILQDLRDKVDRSDRTIKKWVQEAAQRIEQTGVIPTYMISTEITTALKGTTVSLIYVRSCLEEKYKEQYRVRNSRKRIPLRKKKVDFGNGYFAEIQKSVTNKLQDLRNDDMSKYTKQEIKKMSDVETLRKVALYQFHKAEVFEDVSQRYEKELKAVVDELKIQKQLQIAR